MKAFIFDLDGVVADTASAHLRSWERLADEQGFMFDAAAREAVLGRTREDSLKLIVKDLDDSTAQVWLAAKQRYFLEALAQMGPADALPGVVDLIRAAREQGLPIALASSSRNARAVLHQLKIANLFDIVADGLTVPNPKPAPDIFLWCAAMLELPVPDCVVFEDAAAGVAAAVAGGFPVVSIGICHPGATWCLPTLAGARPDNFYISGPERGTAPAV